MTNAEKIEDLRQQCIAQIKRADEAERLLAAARKRIAELEAGTKKGKP
jgi:hypothetical protein